VCFTNSLKLGHTAPSILAAAGYKEADRGELITKLLEFVERTESVTQTDWEDLQEATFFYPRYRSLAPWLLTALSYLEAGDRCLGKTLLLGLDIFLLGAEHLFPN